MNNENYILMLDDEKLQLEYLQDVFDESREELKLLKNYKVLATTNQKEFWQHLQAHLPQIIFLDIQMPERSGIEIATEIREKSKSFGYADNLPVIIFNTAFEKYGYKAFSVNAFDFLLKPVLPDTMNSLIRRIHKTYSNNIEFQINHIEVPAHGHFGLTINLPIKEVLYFEADSKSIIVHTETQKFEINNTLLNLEDRFTSFLKVHRAFLVNPSHINKLDKDTEGSFAYVGSKNIKLPISRRQVSELKKRINFYDLNLNK